MATPELRVKAKLQDVGNIINSGNPEQKLAWLVEIKTDMIAYVADKLQKGSEDLKQKLRQSQARATNAQARATNAQQQKNAAIEAKNKEIADADAKLKAANDLLSKMFADSTDILKGIDAEIVKANAAVSSTV